MFKKSVIIIILIIIQLKLVEEVKVVVTMSVYVEFVNGLAT